MCQIYSILPWLCRFPCPEKRSMNSFVNYKSSECKSVEYSFLARPIISYLWSVSDISTCIYVFLLVCIDRPTSTKTGHLSSNASSIVSELHINCTLCHYLHPQHTLPCKSLGSCGMSKSSILKGMLKITRPKIQQYQRHWEEEHSSHHNASAITWNTEEYSFLQGYISSLTYFLNNKKESSKGPIVLTKPDRRLFSFIRSNVPCVCYRFMVGLY